ncbi:MAG TPA: YbhB/YbcL family Raf kinase inhibitor-like protein [Rhodoblastus sp.]|nr:YbhB/YbcL family Raf kinase inhibitor-like protein [Rhodoblastus sp.]
MKLRSSAFDDGDDVPQRFTCDGENLSPPLVWSDAPREARSFALFCDDPDAPRGAWRHWAAYDIPPDWTSLPEGAGASDNITLRQGLNDFGERGYGGPCPPHGHGTHHYPFRLLALSVATLGLSPDATCRDVERAVIGHILNYATLTGCYRR